MRFNQKGMKVSMYYSGKEDAINEVIMFGYASDKGVGIARILGDGMNPAKIVKMMGDVKFDGSGVNLEQFKLLMK